MQKENYNERQEMSFSGKIKEELARQWSDARHCQIAELAAIISMCGKVAIDSREKYSIKVRTENVSVARKYFTLLRKTFNIDTENSVARNKSNGSIYYTVIIKKHESAIKVLQATKLMNGAGEISEEFSISRNLLLRQSCCKRAFIRGAFLAAGSMSNPAKGYHLEIVCVSGKRADQLKSVIHAFEIEVKVVIRKKNHVVYLKEGAQIANLLCDMYTWNHDIFCLGISKVKYIVNHLFFFGFNEPILMADIYNRSEFCLSHRSGFSVRIDTENKQDTTRKHIYNKTDRS